MPTQRLACLHTTVRSTCSTDRSFSFLGDRGMRLAPNEQVMIPGDIWDSAIRISQLAFDGLQGALIRNELEIMRTPPPIFFDEHSGYDDVRTLKVDNNAITLQDPCWGGYVSVG